MQTILVSSARAPDTSGVPPGAGTPTASRSEILHWESLAWLGIGAAWIVSAWPGLLVEWDGLAGAAVLGLGVLAGFVAWQVVVHAARLDQPSSWVGARWQAARPGRRAKSRRLLAVTVMLDAAAWSVSGVSWMVAARAFDWSQTLTGASFQLACGVAFLGWGLLHLPASRRLAASADDLVVVSRRVLGSGPPTIDTRDDETGELASQAALWADLSSTDAAASSRPLSDRGARRPATRGAKLPVSSSRSATRERDAVSGESVWASMRGRRA